MDFKIVISLVVLVYCTITCKAQVRGDDSSLPLAYNGTEIQAGDGATCPNEQTRQESQQIIRTDILNQLQETILPIIRPCSCLSRGETRIAHLDVRDPNQECPQNWQEVTSPVRACRRTTDGACDSVFYSSNGVSYDRVCGRVAAYDYCTVDSFVGNDIEGPYVDGVSITYGSPRQHVWTFAAGCPCNNLGNVPSFVGEDYFCDYGPHICSGFQNLDFPLWAGGACGPDDGCYRDFCLENHNRRWFCQTLPQPTTEDIEVRICSNQERGNEDIFVEQIEVYVS